VKKQKFWLLNNGDLTPSTLLWQQQGPRASTPHPPASRESINRGNKLKEKKKPE